MIIPLSLVWSDGRVFEIDKVLDMRTAGSIESGGVGIRYICKIMGKEVHIFDEEGKWFMEKQKLLNVRSLFLFYES